MIKTALVLAAGQGMRMRPLTLQTPKPLLAVAGRSMLDRALDKLADASVERAVVNFHHLGDQIKTHCLAHTAAPQILLSDETDAVLETGGGIKRARPLLGDAPFFTVNADTLWQDGATPALQRLTEFWNPDHMDVLLLLHATERTIGHKTQGDYFMEANGQLRWRGDAPTAPYMFASIALLKPQLFDNAPDGAFSQKWVWDRVEITGRLYGLVHDGAWYHASTPADLTTIERHFTA